MRPSGAEEGLEALEWAATVQVYTQCQNEGWTHVLGSGIKPHYLVSPWPLCLEEAGLVLCQTITVTCASSRSLLRLPPWWLMGFLILWPGMPAFLVTGHSDRCSDCRGSQLYLSPWSAFGESACEGVNPVELAFMDFERSIIINTISPYRKHFLLQCASPSALAPIPHPCLCFSWLYKEELVSSGYSHLPSPFSLAHLLKGSESAYLPAGEEK